MSSSEEAVDPAAAAAAAALAPPPAGQQQQQRQQREGPSPKEAAAATAAAAEQAPLTLASKALDAGAAALQSFRPLRQSALSVARALCVRRSARAARTSSFGARPPLHSATNIGHTLQHANTTISLPARLRLPLLRARRVAPGRRAPLLRARERGWKTKTR